MMHKLANFTLHDQAEHIERWREFGFEIDPTPRAPLIEVERGEWTEAAILVAVYQSLVAIKREGFEAILIGGLSNAMAYAWCLADSLDLAVIQARTPRERTPDGKFVFRLTGYSKLLLPGQVRAVQKKSDRGGIDMTAAEKLQGYLFTLEVCQKHLPPGTHPAHLERLWELERWLERELKCKEA